MREVPARAREWLQTNIGNGAHITGLAELPGSTSSSLYVVSAHTRNDAAFRCVLRLFTNAQWLAEEPNLAEHEARVLDAATALHIAAPRLIAFARDDEASFGVPAVLMSYVDGAVQLGPTRFDVWVQRLAHMLASIHAHPPPALRWRYRSWVEPTHVTVPPWSNKPRVWERAIEVARSPAPATTDVFLHRDYHPTNVLWRNAAVSGVVDWVNGCLGPAGVDVAHCRLNLALMYGADAAEAFLLAYTARAEGFRYDPYWEVDSVFDATMPAPKYYEPWCHFGLAAIDAMTLCARLDDHVSRLLDTPRGASP